MRKVLVCGYIGFDNFGDEALLHVLVRDLIKVGFTRSNISTITNNPNLTQQTHKINAYNRWNPLEIFNSILGNEIIIFIGGIFQDKTSFKSFLYYFLILITAKVLGKEIVFYGAGVGPLENGISSYLFNMGTSSVRFATVRDLGSARYFPSTALVSTSCDPVWSIEPNYNIQSKFKQINWQQPILGVSLKLDKYLKPIHVQNLEKKITKIINGMKDWQILLIPLMPSEDLPVLYELMDIISTKVNNVDRIKVLDNIQDLPVEDQAGILASCDAVIGMRYHSLVIPLSCGKPVFGFVFDHKVKSLIDYAGQVSVIWKEDLEQPWNFFWQTIEGSTEKAKLAAGKAKKLHENNIALLQKLLVAR